jgi:signal-transduction protein with cAMP-binding, CBS, and nucleotidyltransferase domain
MVTDGVGEIGTLARRPAITCAEDAPAAQVARQLREHGVGCVVVVDESDMVTGIVTERDLVSRVLARDLGPDTKVERIMSRDVISIREDGDLADAAGQMAARECRRLPVVDQQGRVVGVVGFDDIFERAQEVLANLALAVQHERHPSVIRSVA